MNNVTLLGNLTRDFEVRYSQAATPIAVARCGLAVRRGMSKEGQPDVDFINLLAFGKTAENLDKFFKKGAKIAIEGRIQTGSYDKDGVKHYTFEVVVDRFHFVDSKNTAVDVTTTKGFTAVATDDDLPF